MSGTTGTPTQTSTKQKGKPMSLKEAEDLIEYGYLHGYGRVPKCFQIFADRDFDAFELTLQLGVLMERKRAQKQRRKLARA